MLLDKRIRPGDHFTLDGKKLIDERQVSHPSSLGGARCLWKLPNTAREHTLILFTAGAGDSPVGGVYKSKSTPLRALQPVQPRVLTTALPQAPLKT